LENVKPSILFMDVFKKALIVAAASDKKNSMGL